MSALKVGDLIWQARIPGGVCIYLGEEMIEECRADDDNDEELYYSVLHPSEGFLFEPAYYYDQLPREDQ